MQNATQDIDDLIRQVKTGSAFESLAAAEKIGELSRARRKMDDASQGAERHRLDEVTGRPTMEYDLRQLLRPLIIDWSDDPRALRAIQDYLSRQCKIIDDILAATDEVQRTG